jgi:3D (Asp-Asp-Asp) domain-containing protein
MNIYLLQIVVKWFHLLIISIISIGGNAVFNYDIKNDNNDKGLNIVNTVVEYNTIYRYNHKIPSNVTNVLVKGEDGLVYQDELGNNSHVIKPKVDEIVEKGSGPYGEYNGVLTVYGPDCATCDGRGITWCKTPNNTYHNLINDGMYYNDKDFGKVRILAADHRAFQCGTIIEIKNSDLDSVLGIVMDTGSGMRDAYDQGWTLVDLAFETEKNIGMGTNRNTNFSVKRWGW